MVDENGFVVNGFFAGSRRKVTEVCAVLGINTKRVERQKGPADRVTPGVMQAAEECFHS